MQKNPAMEPAKKSWAKVISFDLLYLHKAYFIISNVEKNTKKTFINKMVVYMQIMARL